MTDERRQALDELIEATQNCTVEHIKLLTNLANVIYESQRRKNGKRKTAPQRSISDKSNKGHKRQEGD